jgi:hypothetical protein
VGGQWDEGPPGGGMAAPAERVFRADWWPAPLYYYAEPGRGWRGSLIAGSEPTATHPPPPGRARPAPSTLQGLGLFYAPVYGSALTRHDPSGYLATH